MTVENKEFKGIILLIVGFISLTYGLYYLSGVLQMYIGMTPVFLMFLIPAFTLSGIAFCFGLRFLKK